MRRLYLLVQRFSHLSLVSGKRPLELGFRQFGFNHADLALTAQRSDDFLLRSLPLDMLHSPLSFEIQARWQG